MPSFDDLKAVAEAASQLVGALSLFCTAVALICPKDSGIGKFFGAIGVNLRGHK